jgi:uncharacterized protein
VTTHRIGVISDTHGLLRPEAVAALRGAELIVHAGDAGRPEILDALREIAPVLAVRGNVDRGAWADALPEWQVVGAGPVRLYVLHDVHYLSAFGVDPAAPGYAAIISGHSHRPSIATRDGVVWLNPGSAGPRRFSLPVTVAVIEVVDGVLHPSLIELPV